MFEETKTATCSGCGTLNHILIVYAGDGRANRDRESASCFACDNEVDSEKCFAIFAGETAEGVKARFRSLSNH